VNQKENAKKKCEPKKNAKNVNQKENSKKKCEPKRKR
jgi:hypothetical protein